MMSPRNVEDAIRSLQSSSSFSQHHRDDVVRTSRTRNEELAQPRIAMTAPHDTARDAATRDAATRSAADSDDDDAAQADMRTRMWNKLTTILQDYRGTEAAAAAAVDDVNNACFARLANFLNALCLSTGVCLLLAVIFVVMYTSIGNSYDFNTMTSTVVCI